MLPFSSAIFFSYPFSTLRPTPVKPVVSISFLGINHKRQRHCPFLFVCFVLLPVWSGEGWARGLVRDTGSYWLLIPKWFQLPSPLLLKASALLLVQYWFFKMSLYWTYLTAIELAMFKYLLCTIAAAGRVGCPCSEHPPCSSPNGNLSMGAMFRELGAQRRWFLRVTDIS